MIRIPSLLLLTLLAIAPLAGCQSDDPAKSPKITTIDPNARRQGTPDNGLRTTTGPLESSAKSGLPGVATPQQRGDTPVIAPRPRVDKLELESFPSTVNLDDVPGPDGVTLKLRLYNLDVPLAFALTQGEVEFVLYEGSIKEEEIGSTEPFHIWRFTAAQIGQSGRKTLVGWQYAMSLNWLGNVPTTSVVTLVARIPRPTGGPLYARPVLLAMGPR